MQKTKNTGKKRLGRAVFYNCIIFALLICVSAGALAIYLNYSSNMKQYRSYISTLLDVTIANCDADDLEEAISSNTTTAGYEELQQFMNDIKNQSNIEFIYAVLPLNLEEEDNMMYVMTGFSDEERENGDELVGLGSMSGTEYTPEVAEYYMDQFNAHDGITYYSNKTEFGYMYTGMEAILDSEGNPVCVLAVDIAMDDIFKMINQFVLVLLIGCGIIVVIFLLAQLYWMSKRITKPLKALEDVATDLKERAGVASGPEDLIMHTPETPADDEIRGLADSLTELSVDMQAYMTRLQAETMEKQRISSELEMATQIQASALPSIFPAFPDRPEFDIYASMDPAKEVGGDFYDFFFVDEDHLALVIADVSGKGVPAALFMMISKVLLRNSAQNKESPKEVLRIVNNQLCENNDAEMFVTVWLGILEISTGKLTAANAGHEFPAICRADGQFELLQDKHGFVLAGMAGVRYREYEVQIHHGDTLFVYTDGVPEATDATEQMYGTDRMLAALNTNPHADCKTLLTNVRADIDRFVGEAPQFDDITMMSLKLY